MTSEEREILHKRLVYLGDLMGEGEHHEKGGGWTSKEYKKTLYTLYPDMKPKRDFSNRDSAVLKWCESNRCRRCGGELKQTRKGSLRVICRECNTKFQLCINKFKCAHLTTNLDDKALRKRFECNDGFGRLIDRFKTYNIISKVVQTVDNKK